MRDAAGDIASFTEKRELADYCADKQLRWSVERGFEIIGEALTQLRKFDQPLAECIAEHRKIISFRNILIHGYGQIDHGRTWDIVQHDLPVLRRQLNELLDG